MAGFLTYLHEATAEHLCRTEVSYKWKKEDAETAQEVFFAQAEAKGSDEGNAKKALLEATLSIKTQAAEKCRLEHENRSHCIASKFNANTSLLQKMDFSSRKKLEAAIVEDCEGSIGVCEAPSSSDPRCEEVVAPAAEGKDAKAAGDKKEDKAKKK